MVAELQIFFFDTETEEPFFAEVFPVIEPFEVGTRFAEEFQFHLLEFAHAENEVSGRDLVTEGFTDLTDAERNFRTRGALYVEEVDEDALRRLRTEINGADGVFGNALEGLEHEVEFSYAGKIALAANRAWDLVFGDIAFHLFVAPAGDILFDTLLFHIVFDEIVGAVAGLTALAVHKRIGKTAYVTGRYPHVGIHQNRAVQADVIFVLLDEFLPPSFFDVVFEFCAEGTVIPSVGKTAVDFASAVYEASAFAESDQFIHC